MKNVCIDSEVLESMLCEIERLIEMLKKTLSESQVKSLGRWIDEQDVCELLGIKPRKVESLRFSGRLAYSRIRRKFFYHYDDVVKLIGIDYLGITKTKKTIMNEVKTPQERFEKITTDLSVILESFAKMQANYRPSINDERFMTDAELSKTLHVSRRSLHTYRSEGLMSYYNCCGKTLYKESDVEKLLRYNKCEAWR